jgi:hypothetical protein
MRGRIAHHQWCARPQEAEMHNVRISLIVGTVAVLLIAAPVAANAAAGRTQIPADFTGILIDPTRDATIPVTLHVDSYTTLDQVKALSHTLGTEGLHGTVAELGEMKPRGWVRVGDLIGTLVPVIRSFDSTKGTEIFAVLDRPFPLFQQLERTHSADYPYGMVELNIDANGNGSGTLVAAGRAIFSNDGKILIESYGTKPYHIIGVTEQPTEK